MLCNTEAGYISSISPYRNEPYFSRPMLSSAYSVALLADAVHVIEPEAMSLCVSNKQWKLTPAVVANAMLFCIRMPALEHFKKQIFSFVFVVGGEGLTNHDDTGCFRVSVHLCKVTDGAHSPAPPPPAAAGARLTAASE